VRLTFQLRFHTEFGQSLWLTGDHDLLGNGEIEKAVPLQYLDRESWRISFSFPRWAARDTDIPYGYLLRSADGSVVQDWDRDRVFNPAAFKEDDVLIIDSWNDASFCENAFYTEPFQQVLLKPNHTEVRADPPAKVTHVFTVKAPLLAKGQTLCLLGGTPALGSWNIIEPVLLSRCVGQDALSVQLDLSGQSSPIAYKYGVYDMEQGEFICYEEGENRVLQVAAAPNRQIIINDGFAALPATTWKGAGVAIPVFSLRSESSFGVGEFADLMPLADWCKRAGLKLIQLLPVNDTTAFHSWLDSYPYSAISAFALHPVYVNLGRVAANRNRALLDELEEERKRLNSLPELDYVAVIRAKRGLLRQLYKLQKDETFESQDYQRFFGQNKHWLEPYAAFCYFRDKYATSDFKQWPAHQTFQREEVAALAAEDSEARDGLALNYFIQFHLHKQLEEATRYARANGIIVKGDIAIGVSRCGADAWQKPELYHLDVQAGAPPDAFAAKGQNWGFPTYDWDRMRQDGFAWWKQRFGQMSCYFDAFRIDHILGFFRIWSIPGHAVEGIMGWFVRALPVYAGEFASRGIWFDRTRFTQPFITEQVLQDIFGAEREMVGRQFLQADRSGGHSLKPEFATQRQVESHFAGLKDTERNQRLKQGLFDLISNVLLFEVEGSEGQQFHFRFGIEDTSSFTNLDPHTQARLRELYVDYFYRRQDGFWMKEGLSRLPALKRATNMLVCGEDLGMVPACVPVAMKRLGLLSLEVQRMPKEAGREFSRPQDAPYLSVVTPSTHDMSTIRGWWEEDRQITQKFYNRELGLPGDAPRHCEGRINRAIVLQHLASPAMWSIFQLQDLLGMDEDLRRENPGEERINVPSSSKHHWRFRMHLSLEALIGAQAFNDQLMALILQNGR
jgi:4-alpha-glucanotransferase